MQRVSLHLRGPVCRPLWNRLRRRLVQTSSAGVITTALAGGTLYIASAVEPNLSGIWTWGGETELRLFHTGNRVTAIFETLSPEGKEMGFAEGDVSFVASFSSRSKLKGYVYLRWEDKEMRDACGDAAWANHTYEATINGNYDTLVEEYTRKLYSKLTCAPQSSELQSGSLRRKRTP